MLAFGRFPFRWVFLRRMTLTRFPFHENFKGPLIHLFTKIHPQEKRRCLFQTDFSFSGMINRLPIQENTISAFHMPEKHGAFTGSDVGALGLKFNPDFFGVFFARRRFFVLLGFSLLMGWLAFGWLSIRRFFTTRRWVLVWRLIFNV